MKKGNERKEKKKEEKRKKKKKRKKHTFVMHSVVSKLEGHLHESIRAHLPRFNPFGTKDLEVYFLGGGGRRGGGEGGGGERGLGKRGEGKGGRGKGGEREETNQ